MNLYEKVELIKNAKEEDRLVIFIGSGVSFNSGIPQWKGLVQELARQLSYYKCKKCEYRKSYEKCQQYRECNINGEEFLKIPQFYYNVHPKKYFNLIKTVLDIEVEPNDLNRIIMEIKPKHIITTNYDRLIEKTNHSNRLIYKNIYRDEDLLDMYSNNYIIKMHGDIKDLKNIVLKENDYLSYSQNHILMETKIKSLLLDHTFIFVGYSLNDYNLKLIMKWRDIIADQYNKSDKKCKSFIIDPSKHEKYEKNYYENNSVYVIDSEDLTSEIISNNSSDIKLGEFGKKVYSILNMINNSDSVISKINSNSNSFNKRDYLYDKLQVFKGRNKIAISELDNIIGILTLGEVLEYTLVIRDKEKYNIFIDIIDGVNKKSKYIKNVLHKTGILEIILHNSEKIYIIKEELNSNTLLELEVQNDFSTIRQNIDKMSDSMEKAYYLNILNKYDGKSRGVLLNLNKKYLIDEDIFKLLQLKINLILSKGVTTDKRSEKLEFRSLWVNTRKSLKESYKYLYNIYENRLETDSYKIMQDKLEAIYARRDNTMYYIGGSLYNLYKLKRHAYEYFYYCKLNLIMIDYYTNIKSVLEPYIRGILSTYTPQKNKPIDEFIFGCEQQMLEYELEIIDFEMMAKYINYKKLEEYIEKYSISKLKFRRDIKVEVLVTYFQNLCKSIVSEKNNLWVEYIKNYLLLLSRCDVNQECSEEVIEAINFLIENNLYYNEVLKQVEIFLRFKSHLDISNLNKLINLLLNEKRIRTVITNDNSLRKLFKILSEKIDKKEYSNKVLSLIENGNNIDEIIVQLSPIIADGDKKSLENILFSNLNSISPYNLFTLLADKTISYNTKVEQRFLEIIESNISNKKGGVHTFPDWLKETLDYVVILHILDIINNIKSYEKYSLYSDYIEFVINDNNFDYSKIRFSDYMWRNLFNDNNYRNKMLKNGFKILKGTLKAAIECGYATEEEKVMYIRYFEDKFDNLDK